MDRTGHLRPLLPPHLLQPRHHRGAPEHPERTPSEGQPPLLSHLRATEGPGVGVGGDDGRHLALLPHGV